MGAPTSPPPRGPSGPSDDLGIGAPPPSATAAIPNARAPQGGKKKSNTGLIIGIVAGVILLCLCPSAIGGAWYGGLLGGLGLNKPGVSTPSETDPDNKGDEENEEPEDEGSENEDSAEE